MTSRDVREFDALISSFAESFGNAAVVDLETHEGEGELASALRRVLDGSDVTAADYAVERTYTALKAKNAWPAPAWRECYVLAQLRRCVELLRGGCVGTDAREAQRALDMTIIFGAPSEPLRGLMQAVESACFAGDDDARQTYVRSAPQSGLLFPSEPPSTALGVQCLERVEGTAITVKEFKQRFYSTDTPVVLANLGKDWRALRVWDDLEWWRRFHGHRCVPLEIGRYSDVSDWREDVMTVDDFVDKFMAPSVREDAQNIAYLAQHPLIDQLADLRRDFEIPALCAKSLLRINAWMGTAGTITPCHFDSYDNLLGQVAGYKFVRLYLESDTNYMYPDRLTRHSQGNASAVDIENSRQSLGNFSAVDVENPDLKRFPDFARAKALDVVLGPGDFVFIPARCWHYVRSLTPSISLNFWF